MKLSTHMRKYHLSSPQLFFGLIFILVLSSCSSTPHLLAPPEVTFDEKIRASHDNYVGTLEGCIVGKKEKGIKKLTVAANLEEFINIYSENGKTDENGCYAINLYWKNQPYLLADVYPDPAHNSFTTGGLQYLKAARTVTLEIPLVFGKKNESLTEQQITMYSLSYVLKQIAEEVIAPRIRSLSFAVEDINTIFPIVGAKVSLIAASDIPPVDTLLSKYISQENLRAAAGSSVPVFIIDSETQTQEPRGSMEFSVMNYAEYRLKVEHPNYHPVDEKLYIEGNLDKIVRLVPKTQNRQYDIIDR
ncbi:MAG: hypothetical protein K9N35_01015 [Candidatus Marinimicrobia bacterium]|nr:hypothetical protein [Candidatus Neomarinimicrobiota bacterium]